jgi:Fic family protein
VCSYFCFEGLKTINSAFLVPESLPTIIKLYFSFLKPLRMNLSLLEIIEIKRQELEDLLPMSAENADRLDKKFRLEFNYNSNHIEGNTLTYGETKMLLFFDDVKGEHTLREFEEMKASDVAFKMMLEAAADKERPLTEHFIKELNRILLVRPYWKDAITADGQPTRREILVGDYKKQPNSVRLENGEVFHYASPEETKAAMGDLVAWYREEEEKKDLNPAILAALLHYRFVSIHPFDDGNGRISRLLMNYVLYRHGLQPVIIKSADKPNYLRALHEADGGDLDAFIDYISEQLIWSLDLAISCAKGEEIEEVDDWKKKLKVLKAGLENEEKNLIKKDVDNVAKIIKSVCLPLMEYLTNELREIENMFLNSSSVLFSPFQPDTLGGPRADIFIRAYSNGYTEIHMDFFDFKKNGVNSFSLQGKVRFNFETYAYTITIDNNSKMLLKKAYETVLSEYERKIIVSALAQNIISEIEYKINSKL